MTCTLVPSYQFMSTCCGFTSFTKLKYKKKYIPSARECHWHRDRGDPWLFHCRFPGRKLQCEMLCYYPCFVAFWQTWFGIFVESALIQSLIPTNGENPVWKRNLLLFIKTHLIQWTLVIVNAWIVNNLSLVNIIAWSHRFFYNINYMLNSKHLS